MKILVTVVVKVAEKTGDSGPTEAFSHVVEIDDKVAGSVDSTINELAGDAEIVTIATTVIP
jgi:hypothetical protein